MEFYKTAKGPPMWLFIYFCFGALYTLFSVELTIMRSLYFCRRSATVVETVDMIWGTCLGVDTLGCYDPGARDTRRELQTVSIREPLSDARCGAALGCNKPHASNSFYYCWSYQMATISNWYSPATRHCSGLQPPQTLYFIAVPNFSQNNKVD